MDTSSVNANVAQEDRSAINHKLLQRQSAAPLATIESASRIVKMSLSSPEGKRLFLRFFDITQLHMHYVSKIARLSLPDPEVEAVEQQVLDLIVEKMKAVDLEMVRVCVRAHARQVMHMLVHRFWGQLCAADCRPDLARRTTPLL